MTSGVDRRRSPYGCPRRTQHSGPGRIRRGRLGRARDRVGLPEDTSSLSIQCAYATAKATAWILRIDAAQFLCRGDRHIELAKVELGSAGNHRERMLIEFGFPQQSARARIDGIRPRL